jgi:hypothetical protein
VYFYKETPNRHPWLLRPTGVLRLSTPEKTSAPRNGARGVRVRQDLAKARQSQRACVRDQFAKEHLSPCAAFHEAVHAVLIETLRYGVFEDAMYLFEQGLHRQPGGLATIVEIAYAMNHDGKQRRRSIDEVLDRILRGHTLNAPT